MLRDWPFSAVREEPAAGRAARRTPLRLSGQPPHPAQVEGRAGERHFHAHFAQAPQPEASHAALLFQNADHRFHQRLASPVTSPSRRTAQPRPQATRGRRLRHGFQRSGPTNANQTIHIGSYSIVQQNSYYCGYVLVNGQ